MLNLGRNTNFNLITLPDRGALEPVVVPCGQVRLQPGEPATLSAQFAIFQFTALRKAASIIRTWSGAVSSCAAYFQPNFRQLTHY